MLRRSRHTVVRDYVLEATANDAIVADELDTVPNLIISGHTLYRHVPAVGQDRSVCDTEVAHLAGLARFAGLFVRLVVPALHQLVVLDVADASAHEAVRVLARHAELEHGRVARRDGHPPELLAGGIELDQGVARARHDHVAESSLVLHLMQGEPDRELFGLGRGLRRQRLTRAGHRNLLAMSATAAATSNHAVGISGAATATPGKNVNAPSSAAPGRPPPPQQSHVGAA
jgi:hypothetical protein